MRRVFAVAGYARDEAGRVLLIRHRRLRLWLPPGGEIEPDEAPVDALVRELEEELGWRRGRDYVLPKLGASGLPGLLHYAEVDAGQKGRHMVLALLVHARTDVITPNDEVNAVQWVDESSMNRVRNVPPNVRGAAWLAMRGLAL